MADVCHASNSCCTARHLLPHSLEDRGLTLSPEHLISRSSREWASLISSWAPHVTTHSEALGLSPPRNSSFISRHVIRWNCRIIFLPFVFFFFPLGHALCIHRRISSNTYKRRRISAKIVKKEKKRKDNDKGRKRMPPLTSKLEAGELSGLLDRSFS